MKKIACNTFALLIGIFSFGQKVETLYIKGHDLPMFYQQEEYKYPAFSPAHAYLINGDSAVGKFNFDYFDQSVRYINAKGDTAIIGNSRDISFITILSDTFFYDKGFYEWVASSATTRLAVKHTWKLVERENVGPYGIASPTRSVQTIGKVFASRAYDLTPDEVLVFTKQTTYYISHIKKGFKNEFLVANKSNISDLFPKKDIDNYVKENRLNLNKEEDLIQLFVFVSKRD